MRSHAPKRNRLSVPADLSSLGPNRCGAPRPRLARMESDVGSPRETGLRLHGSGGGSQLAPDRAVSGAVAPVHASAGPSFRRMPR